MGDEAKPYLKGNVIAYAGSGRKILYVRLETDATVNERGFVCFKGQRVCMKGGKPPTRPAEAGAFYFHGRARKYVLRPGQMFLYADGVKMEQATAETIG